MELDKALGKAVREVRTSKALTQEHFGDVLSRSHLSRLESGQHGATLAFIDKVAGALQVHPLTLITLAYLNKDDSDFHAIQRLIQTELFEINKTITTKNIE